MIKKKVTRTILSLLISVFVVFSSASPYHAATNSGAGTVQSGSKTYGTYSWLYSKSGMLGATFANDNNFSTLSVDIDLNGYYSGNLTVTISGVSSFANVGILVQGGYIGTQSSNQVRVQLVYSDHIHIEFYSTTPYLSTSYNWSCSVGVGTLNKIDDSAASSLDNMDSTMNSISAALTSNLTGLPAIYNELSDIYEAMGILSSINNYLAISNMRNSADIPFYSRFAYVNLLRYGTLSDNYLYPYSTQNLGMFPTIVTDNYSDPAYNSDYDVFIPAGKTLHFIYTVSYWANIFDFINSSGNSLNPTVTMIEGNNYYRSYDVSYKNNSSSNIFINIAMNRNVNRSVIPLYLGVYVPEEVATLFGMDFENTYTRLLQQIATGIGNISQQQVIENNTNINNYNSYQTSINNVENNYYQQFNTYENTIEQNNAFDFTGLSNDGINQYHNLFTNVYSISLVKWPLMIVLLGLVIVFILG